MCTKEAKKQRSEGQEAAQPEAYFYWQRKHKFYEGSNAPAVLYWYSVGKMVHHAGAGLRTEHWT